MHSPRLVPLSPAGNAHVHRSWIDTKIHRVSLPEALHCWEIETLAHQHLHHHHHATSHPVVDSSASGTASIVPDDRPEPWSVSLEHNTVSNTPPVMSETEAPVNKNVTANTLSIGSEGGRTPVPMSEVVPEDGSARRRRKRKRKHRQHRRDRVKHRRFRAQRHNHHHQHQLSRSERGRGRHDNRLCRHRLMDHCSWPQCNQACPRLFNPLTGNIWPPSP